MKLFYSKANKRGTVHVWIYLFIIRKAHGHARNYKASFNMLLNDEYIKEIIIHEKIFHVLS